MRGERCIIVQSTRHKNTQQQDSHCWLDGETMQRWILPLSLVCCHALAEEPAPVCSSSPEDCQGSNVCRFWLAESEGSYAVFAGVDLPPQTPLGSPDRLFSLQDVNENEWAPWQDLAWNDDFWQGRFLSRYNHLGELFTPGLPALANCGSTYANARVRKETNGDSVSFETITEVRAGDEILLDCNYEAGHIPTHAVEKSRLTVDALRANAICIDNLDVGPSSKGEQGAFSARSIESDDVIAVSPVLHLHRRDLEILEQSEPEDHELPLIHGVHYNGENVLGQQALLNHCYASPDSNVLLLPLAPYFTYVQHDVKPNAKLRWSQGAESWVSMTPHAMLAEPYDGSLRVELVATRPIVAGEEITLDYGSDWETARNEYIEDTLSVSHLSAYDFNQLHADEPIRTAEEQETNPYPDNLQTGCYVTLKVDKEEQLYADYEGCLRPCTIEDRTEDGLYTARVFPMANGKTSPSCGMAPDEGVRVVSIPHVELMDKPYTVGASNTFRHPIGVDGLFPAAWNRRDPKPNGDFWATPLQPNEMGPIRWADTGNVVTPHGYRIGLDPKVRHTLLEYCNKIGITDAFRQVTVLGNSLEPGTDAYLTLNDQEWYMQRPSTDWRSNLHWLSPGDYPAHYDYLQTLRLAGWDDVLRGIGETLDMDGLVVFHVTFIAMSWSTQGYLHYDVTDTGAKAYNVIVPLLLANETGPELDVQDDERLGEDGDFKIGRYRYEYDVGSMMGDDAYHASSANDYTRDMRMAATIYIADVNEVNVDNIMADYTQAFPPRDRDLLLSWAGAHWKPNDPDVHLPDPPSDHVRVAPAEA